MGRAFLPLVLLGLVVGPMLGVLVLRAQRQASPELTLGVRHDLQGELVVCGSEADARRFAVAGWDRGGGAEAPGCARQDGLGGFVPLGRIDVAFRPRIAARDDGAEPRCVAAIGGAEIPCFDPARKDSFYAGVAPAPGGPQRVFVALDARTRLVAR